MEGYPQPVTGLIKDKSNEKKRHRDIETRYIMMTNSGENNRHQQQQGRREMTRWG